MSVMLNDGNGYTYVRISVYLDEKHRRSIRTLNMYIRSSGFGMGMYPQ